MPQSIYPAVSPLQERSRFYLLARVRAKNSVIVLYPGYCFVRNEIWRVVSEIILLYTTMLVNKNQQGNNGKKHERKKPVGGRGRTQHPALSSEKKEVHTAAVM